MEKEFSVQLIKREPIVNKLVEYMTVSIGIMLADKELVNKLFSEYVHIYEDTGSADINAFNTIGYIMHNLNEIHDRKREPI